MVFVIEGLVLERRGLRATNTKLLTKEEIILSEKSDRVISDQDE